MHGRFLFKTKLLKRMNTETEHTPERNEANGLPSPVSCKVDIENALHPSGHQFWKLMWIAKASLPDMGKGRKNVINGILLEPWTWV